MRLMLQVKRVIAIVLILGIILGSMVSFEGITVKAESEGNAEEVQYYSIDFFVDSEWEQGYNATITINNICEKNIDNWYLSFQCDDEIQNLQSGYIVRHEENQYLVKNAVWNKDIPAGGSVTFTYTALKNSEYVDVPDDYSIDVALLEVSQEQFTSEFVVQSDWGNGFTGVLLITNVSEEAITDWKLNFEFMGEIQNLTGGELTNLGNGMYEVASHSYEQGIAPGATLNIQIVGKRPNSNIIPTEIKLRTVEYWVESEAPKEEQKEDGAITLQMAEIERIKALNGGVLPQMYLDEEDNIPFCINGKYSDVKVVDLESAILSLHDISAIMCIYWEKVSFEEVSVLTNGNRIHYRLQQMYDGLEVRGKQLIVTTDLKGNIVSLNGNFDPMYEVDIKILYDKETAMQVATQELGESVGDGSLILYSLKEGYDEPAWYFESASECIYISAVYGDVLERYSITISAGEEIDSESVREEVTGIYGKFYVEHDLSKQKYYLYDTLRNYMVYNDEAADTLIELATYEESDDNIWKDEEHKLMAYTANVYDYYLNTCGIRGFDRKNGILKVVYNVKIDYAEERNNDNADSNVTNKMGVIRIGTLRVHGIQRDLIAHEYSHLVNMSIVRLENTRESGAISEAYADCIAEFIDCQYGDEQWINGDRNLVEGIKKAKYITERQMYDKYSEITDDEGMLRYPEDVHGNSYIITNCMRKLWLQGYEGDLGNLMYSSLYYLNPEATFTEFRNAFLCAARDKGYNLNPIIQVFDEAGIGAKPYIPATEKVVYELVVMDEAKNPVANAYVTVMQEGILNTYKTNPDGKIDIVLDNTNAYIYAQQGGEAVKIDYQGGKLKDNKITLELNNTTIDYYGVICDSQTNQPVEGAQIRLRYGAGVTCGRYIKDSDGKNMVYYSDAQGMFSINDLDCGTYTLEIIKDGYVIEHERILVYAGIESIEHNMCITRKKPQDQYTIVLRWNDHPKDLDAHLICTNPRNVEMYHIFFAHEGNMSVGAVLDIDDTNGFGPETITVEVNKDYKYTYYVDWYHGSGTWETSGAYVEVYGGNKKITELYVDAENADEKRWNVFTIENGELEVSNIK